MEIRLKHHRRAEGTFKLVGSPHRYNLPGPHGDVVRGFGDDGSSAALGDQHAGGVVIGDPYVHERKIRALAVLTAGVRIIFTVDGNGQCLARPNRSIHLDLHHCQGEGAGEGPVAGQHGGKGGIVFRTDRQSGAILRELHSVVGRDGSFEAQSNGI